MKTLTELLEKHQAEDICNDLQNDFKAVILSHVENYGKDKPALKSFFEDLQHGGCISGMIGEFIYHSDCRKFYVKHIDALEDMKEELENQLGEPIPNLRSTKHYTFVVWLCFEEYCYSLYRSIFED